MDGQKMEFTTYQMWVKDRVNDEFMAALSRTAA